MLSVLAPAVSASATTSPSSSCQPQACSGGSVLNPQAADAKIQDGLNCCLGGGICAQVSTKNSSVGSHRPDGYWGVVPG
uniref:Uncharacterized protein n=1 Tax=Ditylenchus dipsaci TaxID=166011 RepID=A0A915D430_9BILA